MLHTFLVTMLGRQREIDVLPLEAGTVMSSERRTANVLRRVAHLYHARMHSIGTFSHSLCNV